MSVGPARACAAKAASRELDSGSSRTATDSAENRVDAELRDRCAPRLGPVEGGSVARDETATRRWEVAVACVAATIALAAVAFAASVAVPPSLRNLASEVSDGRTEIEIGEAAVVVPADWIVTRESTEALSVRTPDGVLRARLEAVDASPGEIVETAAPSLPHRRELLASGLTVIHADVEDGLIAGVGSPEAAPSVRVDVEVVAPEGGASAYRAAIGDLLEGIRS